VNNKQCTICAFNKQELEKTRINCEALKVWFEGKEVLTVKEAEMLLRASAHTVETMIQQFR
jgi:hypothetical protein